MQLGVYQQHIAKVALLSVFLFVFIRQDRGVKEDELQSILNYLLTMHEVSLHRVTVFPLNPTYLCFRRFPFLLYVSKWAYFYGTLAYLTVEI